MNESEKTGGAIRGKPNKVQKINVLDKRIGNSTALADIALAIDSKANEVMRSHNRRYSRKGVELVKILQLVGLQDTSTDELIGRLLETNVLAGADPDKKAAWIRSGESKRLEHDPSRREGVFSAVVSDVEPGSATAAELLGLGLRYSGRYNSFEGFIDVETALSTLTGTGASVRMRVGRQTPKDGGRYLMLLEAGEELEGARAVLLGVPSQTMAPTNDQGPAGTRDNRPPLPGSSIGALRKSPPEENN